MYNTIIDLSYIFYRSFHITKAYYNVDIDLTVQEDRGFLIRKVTTDLCKLVRELNSDKIFITCDSYPFRKDLYIDYKNRGEKENGFKDTQQELISIYTKCGMNVLQIVKLEADDIMALIHAKLPNERKIIVTGDEDLRQLLDYKTYCYNADSKHKTFFYTTDSQLNYKPKEGLDYFYERVDPEYVLFLKIVKGCSTDNVPGLAPKGFRLKKVEEMYKSYLQSKTNDIGVDEDTMFEILSLEFKLDRTRFNLQLRLVCLQSEYMPNYSVDKFEQIFENKAVNLVWEMKEILKGTPYITEDFNS
jgi:5'-3' exonuclease